MSLELRPYQQAAIDACRRAYSAHRRVLLQAATGAGKTCMATFVVQGAVSKGRRVLYVVHRDEILQQTVRALGRVGIIPNLLTAGRKVSGIPPGTVLLASAQTLARRDVPAFDFGVWDESHTFYALQQRIQGDKQWLKLTATPALLTGQPLSKIADVIVEAVPMQQLIDDGYLVPLEMYAAESPDLHGIPVRGGEFEPAALEAVYRVAKLVGSAPRMIRRYAMDGDRVMRTLIFCAGVKHSQETCAQLCAAGIRAVHIDGETPKAERDAAFEDLRAQRIDVICNVAVAIEGLDLIELECVYLLRAMHSLANTLQAIGRVMRPAPGKNKAVLLDGGGNVYRHGYPAAARQWTLDGKVRVASDSIGLRTCEECLAIWSGAGACPRCGEVAEVVGRNGPKTAPGDLRPITAAELGRIAAAASRATPPRPPPTGCKNDGLWRTLEAKRAANGYDLGDGTRAHPGYTVAMYRRLNRG